MRLISQDGYNDFQYENTMLEVGWSDVYKGKPREYPIYAAFNNQSISIAHYSSLDKCIKVMEMVRNDYLSYLQAANSPYAFIQPKVFQFPKDEDVEV